MKLLTNRANQSIFFALFLLKKYGIKTIYIPDQGGWISYKVFPKFLDLKVKILRTNKGVPEEEDLKEIKNSALILCSSPGYLRDLSKKMWQIKDLLNENNSFLINDNSSGFSFDGDIVVMSFGKWKPMNLGIGGLLEIKNEELSEFAKKEELDKFFKFQVRLDEEIKKLAEEKLKNIDELVNKGVEFANKYKKEFKDYLIKEIGKEKSLNVPLVYSEELIKELKEKNLPFRLMPDYIRLKIKGISLETKKIFYK
jgi:hypothetical protein